MVVTVCVLLLTYIFCNSGIPVEGSETCYPFEFACASGMKCIPISRICNLRDDCGDNSDEAPELCRNNTKCEGMDILCGDSGYCIYEYKVCDGETQCPNGEDEIDCENKPCKGLFECANKICLPNGLRCDFYDDCQDGSDEMGCNHPACSSDNFQCDNQKCINPDWLCDGDNDCIDGSDEKNCP